MQFYTTAAFILKNYNAISSKTISENIHIYEIRRKNWVKKCEKVFQLKLQKTYSQEMQSWSRVTKVARVHAIVKKTMFLSRNFANTRSTKALRDHFALAESQLTPATLHNVYIGQFFSSRPSALRHILKFWTRQTIQHIFVPTRSVEGNIEKIRFS